YVFEDANRDGAVSLVNTTTAGTMIDDRVVEVDISPSWSGSLSLDYDIKRFTISAQIYYVDQMGQNPAYGMYTGQMRNVVSTANILNDHWRRPGDQARYSRFSTSSDAVPYIVQDKSFLRLNNVALSYQLNPAWTQKAKIQQMQIAIRMQNLWTIT